MAKDAKPEAAETDAGASPKKSKKLLIIVAAVVLVVLLAGGAAAYLLLSGHNTPAGGEEGEVAAEKAKADKKKEKGKEAAPVFVALDAFTVNLDQEGGGQYLQAIMSVEVEDVHAGDKIKTYTPKLRNDIIRLLSGKKAADLLSRDGKEALAGEIRKLMNAVLEPDAKEGPVKEVLFTSFIIQ